MEFLIEKYYSLAKELLKEHRYDRAIEYLVKVFNAGMYKKEILNTIYDEFIIPKQKVFIRNYEETINITEQIPYEKTNVEFIPISDSLYWLFFKEECKFGERVNISCTTNEIEFDSLLITNIEDFNATIEKMCEKNWSRIYVINSIEKEWNSFFSIYKIEFFSRKHDKIIYFKTDEEFKQYFLHNKNEYLPQYVYSREKNKYLDILDTIHRNRLSTESTSCNVYLSICIPTHNRGSIALRNVLNMLSIKRDAEIEIIVSDNGSDNDVEGYRIISSIKDSRLKYYRHKEDLGAAENYCSALAHATGKFAVLTSDEDTIIVEKIGEYFKLLKNNEKAGIIITRGMGAGFARRTPAVYKMGIQAIQRVLDVNYSTGLTYNTSIFKQCNLFSFIQNYCDNIFYKLYPHMALAMVMSLYGDCIDSSLILWDAWVVTISKDAEVGLDSIEDEEIVYTYSLPESRVEQLNGEILMLDSIISEKNDAFWYMLIQRMDRRYYLSHLICKACPKSLSVKYKWLDICSMINNNNRMIIKRFNLPLEITEELNNIYLKWVSKDPF